MNRLCYLCSGKGLRLSYDRFWSDVAGCQEIPSIVYPASGYECLVLVVAAAVRGKNLAVAHAPEAPSSHTDRSPGVGTTNDTPSSAAGSPDGLSIGTAEIEKRLREVENSTARIGIFSSGSTGTPKCVWHSMPTLMRSLSRQPHHQQDVWGFAYHPAHFAGLQVLLQALLHQNPIINLFNLPARDVHQAIDRHQVTHISATPTYFRKLLGESGTHPSVRRVTTGGEASSPGLRQALSAAFPNAKILNIYASTEAGSLLVAEGEHFRVPDRLSNRVRVIDGQLAVHQSLMGEIAGYQLAGEFYLTGDLVHVIETDPLTVAIHARANELINVGGYKVAPQEVEARLLEMDEVAEAFVYGKRNSVTGFLVACDLVPADASGIDVDEVRRKLADVLQPYQVPRFLRVVDSIDQTSTGKLKRGKVGHS